MAERIEREIVVDVPQERVWNALVDPEELRVWFGEPLAIDLRPGGQVRVDGDDRRFGVVEEVEAPRRLVFRWWPDRPFTVAEGSRVEVSVDDHGAGTRVRIVEERLARRLGFEARRVAVTAR